MNIKTAMPERKLRKTERPMTATLFMLRCVELGPSTGDLDLLTIGFVNAMFLERVATPWNGERKLHRGDMDYF